MKTKILFVCTANENRSPTAEKLFKKNNDFEVDSAGIHPFSIKPLNNDLIQWADIIIIMNEKNDNHKTLVLQMFPQSKNKPIIDLEIPDIYEKDNPELKRLIFERMKKKRVLNKAYQ